MLNFYYKDTIEVFLLKSSEEIIGSITLASQFDARQTQNKAWEQEISILKDALKGYTGYIF
jgi:hypothetical protein